MTDSGLISGKIHASKGFEKSLSANSKLKQHYSPGDIAWIKNRYKSWWPVQVVDENTVGSNTKKKKKDEILVRVYGSCDYLYVDPSRFSIDFENYIKQENVTTKEAIQKALEKDLHHISGSNSKRKVSESKEISSAKTPEGKQQKQEMIVKDPLADNSPSPWPSSTKKDEERGKQLEKVADAGDEENEATKSMVVTKPLEEPHANSVKVNTVEKKNNCKSGIKVTDQSNLRQSHCTTVKELTPENAKVESCKNNNQEQSELVLQNQAEKLQYSIKQLNAGEMKQEVKKYTQRKVTAEQMRRTDEEIRKLVILELAKHRWEQAGMTKVQHEADKNDPKRKNMNSTKNQKTGSPDPAKNHTPEETPNLSARKIRVMQNLGLMAPSGSPYCGKRKR